MQIIFKINHIHPKKRIFEIDRTHPKKTGNKLLSENKHKNYFALFKKNVYQLLSLS